MVKVRNGEGRKSVLQRRNYLFSAPAPTLAIISAPATAIYWHLKLFKNTSSMYTIEEAMTFSSF